MPIVPKQQIILTRKQEKLLGMLSIHRSVYQFILCILHASVPKGVLESILEFVLESDYQALELLDFRPIFAYNSSNISCFSGKYAVCLLIFAPNEPWHSRGQRFDPAYLHHRKSHRKPFGLRCFSLFSGKFQTFYTKLIFAQNRQKWVLSTKSVNKSEFQHPKGTEKPPSG